MKIARLGVMALSLGAIAVLLVIAIGVVQLSLSNSGQNCSEMTLSEQRRYIIQKLNEMSENYEASGFSFTGPSRYDPGRAGDILTVPFRTNSGKYLALIGCDGSVELSKGL
ncbi:hypothetical protein [Vreelandella glaciei]|uniref:hypothetical protein n=1 Tax=Vreelandella glaciei TaxID=186761 RepID=UPI0030EBE2E9|tara:strand:- start:1643 stop:1975 length:333 start_codon:yes stop_codon:yes gene_type:complete